MGLDTVTHFYGHFESLLKDGRLPKYPSDYNMFNKQDRFYEIANLADQVVEPGSPEWQAYLEAQLENGAVFNTNLNIYSAGRDLLRARNADWHVKYTRTPHYRIFQQDRVNTRPYW